LEGFEDWRMDDELAERHGQATYDDETDWNVDDDQLNAIEDERK
jgi:hypothetical protein